MICKECENKPRAKGIHIITCRECGCDTFNNVDFVDICHSCCEKENICEICGKLLKE